MAASKNKPFMRNLGEFFGHIIKGVKTDPRKDSTHKQEVRREVEEQEDENMILRRTTIEEIEFKNPPTPAPGNAPENAPENAPDQTPDDNSSS